MAGFLPGIFSGGGKTIVMQISFVMLIFVLFSDQISRRDKVSEGGGGGKLRQGPPNSGRKTEDRYVDKVSTLKK